MYNLTKNNYHQKPKNSSIQTPPEVSQFIFELLKDKFSQDSLIFDPCCGRGNLLSPWERTNYKSFGIDTDSIIYWLGYDEPRWQTDFLQLEKSKSEEKFLQLKTLKSFGVGKPDLVLCNPPFNGYGHKLGSEVWLDKIIELFGKDIPIVLFAPVGFCANLTLKSKRREKFDNGTYPPICSHIALPKSIFPGVIFHSEILIFNVKGLKGHYFLPYEPKK